MTEKYWHVKSVGLLNPGFNLYVGFVMLSVGDPNIIFWRDAIKT